MFGLSSRAPLTELSFRKEGLGEGGGSCLSCLGDVFDCLLSVYVSGWMI